MAFQSSTAIFAHRYQKYKLARAPRCHIIRVVRIRHRKGNYIHTHTHTHTHTHAYMYALLFR